MIDYRMLRHTISEARLDRTISREVELIADFRKNGMDVKEFVDRYKLLEDIVGDKALWFPDSRGFYNFIRMECGIDAAKENVEHEQQHMDADMIYGLESQMGIIMVYPADRKKPRRLNEIKDLSITPMVGLKPEAYEKMKMWNKDMILQYLLDGYSVDKPSPDDQRIIDILKE